MRVHAPKLICSTGVSNFQTFKLLFRMYSKLCLPAAILSWWVFDVILSSTQLSQDLEVSNGGPLTRKISVEMNRFLFQMEA